MTDLPLSAIQRNPAQPRETFAPGPMEELAQSIRTVGVMSPIVVRPVPSRKGQPGGWMVVAGERRLRAAAMAGLERIPVVVRDDLDDDAAFELAVIENVIRQDMDPLEEARGYRRLVDQGMTVETISARIGKSVPAIRARLKLLDLVPAVADLVAHGQLDCWSAGHVARLAPESQFKVMRAMSGGMLPPGPLPIARLCTALEAQDQQVAMLDDAPLLGATYTTLTAVPAAAPARQAARDLARHIASTLGAIERLAELLEADVTPDGTAAEIAATSQRLDRLTARVTKTLHAMSATRLADDLAKES